MYANDKVKEYIPYTEAEAKLLTEGRAEKKTGFQVETSAEAGAAKADCQGQIDFLGIIKIKGKLELSGGSTAIGGKAGTYLDYDDFEVKTNIVKKVTVFFWYNSRCRSVIKC